MNTSTGESEISQWGSWVERDLELPCLCLTFSSTSPLLLSLFFTSSFFSLSQTHRQTHVTISLEHTQTHILSLFLLLSQTAPTSFLSFSPNPTICMLLSSLVSFPLSLFSVPTSVQVCSPADSTNSFSCPIALSSEELVFHKYPSTPLHLLNELFLSTPFIILCTFRILELTFRNNNYIS